MLGWRPASNRRDEREGVWVVAGTLFLYDSATATFVIGDNGAGVPSHFYKAILAESPAGARATFGLLMANGPEPPADEPRDFLVNLDSLAVLTDLDFFNQLPDSQETELEVLTVTWWPIRLSEVCVARRRCWVSKQRPCICSRPFRNAERRRCGL